MPTVLIIEDMDDLRAMMRRICETLGYAVMDARNGEDGIKLAETTTPALIIVDLAMPFVSGAAVMDHVRGSDTLKHVPVIFISALPDGAQVARKYNAEVFLAKPFDPNALRQAIAQVSVR